MSLNSSPMSLSAEALLALVHKYYRADRDFDIRPENSPEEKRLLTVRKQEFGKMDQWDAFVDELRAALPDLVVGNITSTCNPSFRCAVYPRVPKAPAELSLWVVVGCISILAPVYTVYGLHLGYRGRQRTSARVFLHSLPPEMQAPAELIARKLEATFGLPALPRELAETPVPLIVEFKEPPHTTLFDALFISRPESVPL